MEQVEDDLSSLKSVPLDDKAREEASIVVRNSYIAKAFDAYFRRQYKEAMVLLRKVRLNDVASIGIFVNCAYDFWRSVNTGMALAPTTMTNSRLLLEDHLEPDQVKEPEPDPKEIYAAAEAQRRQRMRERMGKRAYSTVRMNVTAKQMLLYDTHNAVKAAPAIGSQRPESSPFGPGSPGGTARWAGSTAGGRGRGENTGGDFDGESVESSLGMEESMFGGSNTSLDDQTEALETVQKAFTQLLGGRDRHLIQAFDYVRLSHVYITEGALGGALQVCQLGQARGHLENTMLVLQCWSLLKRLQNRKREAEQCMQFLVSAVQLEGRNNVDDDPKKKSTQAGPVTGYIMVQNSDLPLSHVYLFCASYLQRRHVQLLAMDRDNPNHHSNGNRERELCYNMLAEAYFVRYGTHNNNIKELMAWFMDADMFFDIAVYMENTAFPLLAEEALFEAFIRAPLQNLALEFLVALMYKHKRGAKRYVFEVMLKAHKFNPWNMFMRAWLFDYEAHEVVKMKSFDNKFQKKFAKENLKATKIQRYMRGYILRVKRWPAIYWAAKKKRDEFEGKVQVAESAFNFVQKALMKDRVRRWKQYCDYLFALRKLMSTKIQRQFRRLIALRRCRRMYARAIRANGAFLLCAQSYYDFQRTRRLRQWEAIWRQRVLDRSATTLVQTLIANGYSKVFHAACEQILRIIRVRRKWSNRKYFHEIRKRYLVREKRHARATIRFWIRFQIMRAREKKRKEILERRERAVQILQAKSTAYIKPLMSLCWKMWREVLHEKRCVIARAKVRVWLPRRAAMMKAKAVVTVKRVKWERHRAFEMQSLFNRLGKYLIFWRHARAVLPIQRGLRCKFARTKRKRMAKIWKRVLQIERFKHSAIKEWALFRCRKFLFLVKREYHRAARKITLAFQNWLKWKHIKRASKRKPAAYKLLWTMHCKVLGRAFKKMASGVTGLHTLLVLGPLFLSRWRQVVRLGFWRWTRYTIQQRRMDGVIRAATARLERSFWKGCSDSMAICKKLTYAPDELGPKGMIRTAIIMSWETPVPVHHSVSVIGGNSVMRLFQNSDTRVKVRAFQTFMASYRYKMRIVRNGSLGAGKIARELVHPLKVYLFYRQRAARNIQCSYRQHLARLCLYKLRMQYRRHEEVLTAYKGRPMHAVWSFLYARSRSQFESRWKLQCFFRRMLSVRKLLRRRDYASWLNERAEMIRLNSRSRRAIVQKVWHKMQIVFMYSISGHHLGGMVTSVTSLARRIAESRLALNNNITPPIPGFHGELKEPSGGSSSIVRRNKAASEFTHAPLSSTNIRSKTMHIKASSGSTDIDIGTKSISGTASGKLLASSSKRRPDGALFMRGAVKYGYSRTEEYKDAHGLGAEEDVYGYNDVERKNLDMQLSLSLHRLQQTGVFIYDPSSQAIAGKDLAYILQGANIIFCQNVNSQALSAIFEHYRGTKLVLCGGGFSFHDAILFTHYLSRRRDALSLHFSDVTGTSFNATLALLLCLGAPTEAGTQLLKMLCAAVSLQMPPPNCMSHLKELSIDTSSLGSMGLVSLLSSMRLNGTVEILIIKFTLRNDLLQSSCAKSFQQLSGNNTLKELRIFGCALGHKEVRGLYDAIWGGLRGLALLEFSAAPDARAASDEIIRLAKDRLYAGRGSLSVSVI